MAKKKQNRKRPASKKKKSKTPRQAGFFGWVLFWPYHLTAAITANWPAIFRIPSKLIAAGAALGTFGLALMACFYGFRSLPYDLAEVRNMPQRTTVLDRTGKEIARLHGENRAIIPLAQVAPSFQDALLAREDSRFRSHPGVDPLGLARSLIQNIKRRGMRQGGSTLTMQLARNTFELENPTLKKLKAKGAFIELDRKFLEMAVSFRIELAYSKDEILEAYVNRIFWGHSYRGIEAASQNYFGKPASEITLSESALLAGIIRGPNAFTPQRYPERAKRERDTTLDSMVRENFLSQEEADNAKKEVLKIKKTPEVEVGWSFNIIQRELDDILSRENIKRGGLTITTTLDSVLQTISEDTLESQLRAIESSPRYRHTTRSAWQRNSLGDPDYLQGAIVLLDTKTGAVRSLVGGRSLAESTYDRAQWSSRSAGSLFKPFVYLAAYEKGMLPETWVDDTPLQNGEVSGAPAGWPANADNKYSTRMRTAEALIRSRNAATVRVGTYAGIPAVMETARAAGLLQKGNADPTLFLGTSAASPWELAQAYTTFPNGGSRVVPYLIDKIQDSSGRILYETRPLKQIVARPETAGLIHNLLREVTTKGTAASLRSTHGFRAPAAGKTGTTNDYNDAWYAGYTSSLTGVVWVGLDQPETIVEGGYGGSLALPIWANIFKKASSLRDIGGTARYPSGDLDPNLVYRQVTLCRLSGKRVTSGCQAAGTAYQDLVPEGLLPAANDLCPIHPQRALPAPEARATPPEPRNQPLFSQTSPPREQASTPQRALPAPADQGPTGGNNPVRVQRALPYPHDIELPPSSEPPLRALPVDEGPGNE